MAAYCLIFAVLAESIDCPYTEIASGEAGNQWPPPMLFMIQQQGSGYAKRRARRYQMESTPLGKHDISVLIVSDANEAIALLPSNYLAFFWLDADTETAQPFLKGIDVVADTSQRRLLQSYLHHMRVRRIR